MNKIWHDEHLEIEFYNSNLNYCHTDGRSRNCSLKGNPVET